MVNVQDQGMERFSIFLKTHSCLRLSLNKKIYNSHLIYIFYTYNGKNIYKGSNNFKTLTLLGDAVNFLE